MPIVLHNEGDTPKGIYVVRDYFIKFVFMNKALIDKATIVLDPKHYKNVILWPKFHNGQIIKTKFLFTAKQ